MSDRALIIDGNNFYSIAYWSANKEKNSEFIPIRFFERLADSYNFYKKDFVFLFVVWDSRENNRKKENVNYKANRDPKPDDFYNMMPYIKDILNMRGVQQYEVEGYEGDDLIYSIVEMCKEKGYKVTVASRDHDMYQLITDNINIYDPMLKKIVGYKEFIEEFGITPEQWKYVKALMGDTSDNIKGVKGIGEKSALEIISKYKDLDNFYKSDMSNIGKGIRTKMTIKTEDYDAKEEAYNSLKMVEFRKVELEYPSNAVINSIKVNRSLYMEEE
jgi:DNA polymerase-1